MSQIIFKGMESSDFLRQAVEKKISIFTLKFCELKKTDLRITLEMLNSPFKSGPDLFLVKINIVSGRFKDLTIQKTSLNIYGAVADVFDCLLELINRKIDKDRVKQRNLDRKWLLNEIYKEA